MLSGRKILIACLGFLGSGCLQLGVNVTLGHLKVISLSSVYISVYILLFSLLCVACFGACLIPCSDNIDDDICV